MLMSCSLFNMPWKREDYNCFFFFLYFMLVYTVNPPAIKDRIIKKMIRIWSFQKRNSTPTLFQFWTINATKAISIIMVIERSEICLAVSFFFIVVDWFISGCSVLFCVIGVILLLKYNKWNWKTGCIRNKDRYLTS